MTAEPRLRGERVAATVRAVSTAATSVRGTREADIETMLAIIGTYVERRLLLARTYEEIADEIDTWRVAELDGEVVGCAALHDLGEGLGELRSLSVLEEAHGRALGELLVRAIVCDAEHAGIGRLLVITRIPRYFARLGFISLPVEEVPAAVVAERVPWPRRLGGRHAMELRL